MNSTTTSSRKNGIFYGWYTLAGVLLVIVPMGGAFLGSFGVLLPEVTKEFSWGRGEVSLALTLGILAFGMPSPLYGFLTNRFGSRRLIIIGNALAALALAGVSLAQEVWHLYILYLLTGLGMGVGGFIADTAIVNNWFIRRRSLALGIMQACSGLAGSIYPPFATAVVGGIGWRSTWLIFAGIIITTLVIGAGLIIRNKPEDKGLMPDGMPPDAFLEYEEEQSSSVGGDEPSGWGIFQVLRKPTVWLIGGFTAANAFTFGSLSTHQIAYIQDIGFSPMTAATTMTVLAAFISVGSLGFGFLALKFNPRYLTIAAFSIQVIALVILLTIHELVFIYIYAILMGYSIGSVITAYPTLAGVYYPRHRYSQVLGVIFPFHILAHAASATIAGAVHDATTSYTSVFIVAALCGAAGLTFAFLARRPKSP